MTYNFKEYNTVFDTPIKIQQELAISRKIMDLLNKKKYDNLESFIEKNKTYQDFLKNNNMLTVIKHFGNELNEEDYTKIIQILRQLSLTKQQEIKATNLENEELTEKKSNTETKQDKQKKLTPSLNKVYINQKG